MSEEKLRITGEQTLIESELEELKLTSHRKVIELVEEAGVDVSDWQNFKGGSGKAASNPKHCYEW